MNFETELTIHKLKIANNISDIRAKLKRLSIINPDFEKNEILLWELKSCYNGLEFAQELYYKTGEQTK